MKSSSLKIAKNLGIPVDTVRIYRDALIHDWFLGAEYRQKLDIFVLRETTPEKLFFAIKDGAIYVKGRSYAITWINSPDAARKAQFLLVSLRYCRHLESGYALVQILKGDSVYEKLEY